MRYTGAGTQTPDPCRSVRGVRETTPLVPTESPRARAQPIDIYRSTAPGGGLGPRSLVLHLAQHDQPTVVGLAVATTMPTLCGHCAIDPFVKAREPPSPLGTRVGCNPTGVTEGVVV